MGIGFYVLNTDIFKANTTSILELPAIFIYNKNLTMLKNLQSKKKKVLLEFASKI